MKRQCMAFICVAVLFVGFAGCGAKAEAEEIRETTTEKLQSNDIGKKEEGMREAEDKYGK